MIQKNLEKVWQNIDSACKKVGRNPSEVTLIAVSKTKPVSMLAAVYADGVREFGENKVQELIEKQEQLPNDIHWHMIGHLQRNKVRQIVDKACLIHSVDSLRLAEEVSLQAEKKQVMANILVEINIANEETKFGISKEAAYDLVKNIAKLSHISIKGLMSIAPFVENPEDNRNYFQRIKKLSVDIAKKKIDNVTMDILSMGMTGDYMVAIEEGATMVRVGTGIFGIRNYNI
ncbi:YggS family pyridoxal phosphate-dependent enzyme [Lachnospiraceae bacterium ZAX-1]